MIEPNRRETTRLAAAADLAVMEWDARAKRGELPFLFLSLTDDPQAGPVAGWVRSCLAAAPV